MSQEESEHDMYRIADVDELTEDGDQVIEEVEGKEIAVYNVEGEYYAILNYCVHQSGPLCEGEGLECNYSVGDDGWEWTYDDSSRIVRCPWHGWRFDVRSGVNTASSNYRVPTFDVEIRDGGIYVDV